MSSFFVLLKIKELDVFKCLVLFTYLSKIYMEKYAQLERINSLKEKWVLTDKEFELEKYKILHEDTEDEMDSYDDPNEKPAKKIKSHFAHLPTYHTEVYSFWSWHTFFSPKWRIKRSTFWWVLGWSYLLVAFIWIVAALIIPSIGEDSKETFMRYFGFISLVIIPICVWMIIVSIIKRLHDVWQTGWLWIIPVYNFIVPAFVPWNTWDNQYWPQSK